MAKTAAEANHTVIAAGQFTVSLLHPLYNSGVSTTIGGFKLEGQMVQDQQAVESSKIVALANGGTITITNNNDAGSLTFAVTKQTGLEDMVRAAIALRRAGDSVGGTIAVTQEINGKSETETYYKCTVKSCPKQLIQGNDAPDYQVVWNYAYSLTTEQAEETEETEETGD